MLHILDLKSISLATKKDKENKLDVWAELFKATTWEEINMLATKNDSMKDTKVFLAQLTEEEKTRQMIEAHEEFLRRQRYREQRWAEQDEKLAKASQELSSINEELASKNEELASKNAEIEILKQRIQVLERVDTK